MFTGLVTAVGTITAIEDRNDLRRLQVACDFGDRNDVPIGASVSCSGVCLTAVEIVEVNHGIVVTFEAAPESLRLTTIGDWRVGSRINMERSLRAGDDLGGHLVAGHVDALARIVEREVIGDSTRFAFEVPIELTRFVAPKGSVSLDGTSLTVNGVNGQEFDCLLVPHTLAVTTWGERRVGDRVNFEVDMLARYVANLMPSTPEKA